jgi:hypothetical protein
MPEVTVEAAQLLYGGLSSEDSTSNREGYQIICRTGDWRGYGTARVEAFTSFNLPVPPAGAPAQSFFVVEPDQPQGLVCLGHKSSVYLESRGKQYWLTHMLLVEQESFLTHWGGNPFHVLNSHPFATTTEAALSLREPTDRRQARPAQLRVSTQRDLGIAELGEWRRANPAGLTALLTMALGARGLLTDPLDPRWVAFCGTPEQVQATLAALMVLLPPEGRLHCSFNTFSDEGNGKGARGQRFWFWGCGLPNTPTEARCLLVDVDKRRVDEAGRSLQVALPRAGLRAALPLRAGREEPRGEEAARPLEVGLYGRWLLEGLEKQRSLEDLFTARQEALRVVRIINGEEDVPPGPASEAFEREFKTIWQPNELQVREQAWRRTRETLSRWAPTLTKLYLQPWLDRRDPQEMLRLAGGRLDLTPAAELLLLEFLRACRPGEIPGPDLRQEVDNLLRQYRLVDDPYPLLVATAWRLRAAASPQQRTEEWRDLQHQLKAWVGTDPKESRRRYKEVVKYMLGWGWAGPAELYLRGRARDLVRVAHDHLYYHREDLLPLVAQLAAADRAATKRQVDQGRVTGMLSELDALSDVAKLFDREWTQRDWKEIEKYRYSLPVNIQHALHRAFQRKNRGWW